MLTSEEKKFIPYSGLEKLEFVSDLGDTATFNGHGRSTYIEEEWAHRVGTCDSFGVYVLERDTVNFSSDTLEMKIELMLQTMANRGSKFALFVNEENFYVSLIQSPQFYSASFNGIEYMNVYYSHSSFDNTELYYTKREGIIRFQQGDQITWTLIP